MNAKLHGKELAYILENGGGPMYFTDLEKSLQVFGTKLYRIYGQGESPMTITGLSKRDHEHALAARDVAMLASGGCARTGVEVRVVDDNDSLMDSLIC